MVQQLFMTDKSLDDELSQHTIRDEIRRLERRIHQLQLGPDPDLASIVALGNQHRERLMVLNRCRGHRATKS